MPNLNPNPASQGRKSPSFNILPLEGGKVLSFSEWADFLRRLNQALNSLVDYANEIYQSPNMPTTAEKAALQQMSTNLTNILNSSDFIAYMTGAKTFPYGVNFKPSDSYTVDLTNTISGRTITIQTQGGNAYYDVYNGDVNVRAFVGNAVIHGSISVTIDNSLVFTTLAVSNLAAGGAIGTAAATVDIYTSFTINQTTASQTITLPTPTVTTVGRTVSVMNVGSVAFTMLGTSVPAGQLLLAQWNGSAWVTLAGSAGITSLTGDVTGTGPGAAATTVVKINGVALGSTTATEGNLLQAIGSSWVTHPLAYGELYMQGNATATTISGTSTPTLMLGTTSAGILSGFTFTVGSNRITYTGTPTRIFEVIISASMGGGINEYLGLSIAKNGSQQTKTLITAKLTTPSGRVTYVSKGLLSMATNDYLQAFVQDNTASSNVTVVDINLTAKEIGT